MGELHSGADGGSEPKMSLIRKNLVLFCCEKVTRPLGVDGGAGC